LVGEWRCSTDGSKLVHNADGTGEWTPLNEGSAPGYKFKWNGDGQSLTVTAENVPQPQSIQYAFDSTGSLLLTGPDGRIVSYTRTSPAPGGLTPSLTNSSTLAMEPTQRKANRGDGPRMWADDLIEQSHMELTRSEPQLTDTPDQVQEKVKKLLAAATEIRSMSGSAFPEKRSQYEKYASDLEAKAQEWTARSSTGGSSGGIGTAPGAIPGGSSPLSSGFGAPPR
jgi:hypothetical protein